MRFSTRLCCLRGELRWSQRKLARLAGTTHVTVRRLEGDEQDPTLPLLRRLARALRISVGDLVDPRPAPPKTSVAEARRRLAELNAEEAALDRQTIPFAAHRRHRPLSARIRAAQAERLGRPLAAAHFRSASRAAPLPDEAAQARALDDRRERIERERQQAVLGLVAAGGLFKHRAVRQCYRDAYRLGDRVFLQKLADAVVVLPPPIRIECDGESFRIRRQSS